MRMLRLVSVVSLAVALALAQLNTSTMDGIVSDPQGALIPNAEVTVTNNLTGQVIKTLTNDRGHWVVPSLHCHLQCGRGRGRIQEGGEEGCSPRRRYPCHR